MGVDQDADSASADLPQAAELQDKRRNIMPRPSDAVENRPNCEASAIGEADDRPLISRVAFTRSALGSNGRHSRPVCSCCNDMQCVDWHYFDVSWRAQTKDELVAISMYWAQHLSRS